MAEEALQTEELEEEIEQEVEIPEEKQESPSFSREQFEEAQRKQAESNGWKDFDPYVKEGGDPTKWRPAEAFNIYGEMVGELRRTKQDFEQRLEGVHKLAHAQAKSQIDKLTQERDALIEEGGRSTEVKALDKQINSLNVQPVQSNALLDDWNNRNSWIKENSPKALWAKQVWASAISSGYSTPDALSLVEREVKKQFPAVQKPAHIPESERGKGSKGFTRSSALPTMGDLSEDEKLAWEVTPEAWNNDPKKFLQAVADDRKAAKR